MKSMRKAVWGRGCVLSVSAIILSFVALMAVLPAPAAADDKMEATQLVERAKMTLDTFMTSPETEAFRSLLKDASGVFVAPQILRGAFILGASGGSGVLVAKNQKTGKWMGPAFYTVGSISFGLQAGGEASEVVLLAMTERGVTSLLANTVKLGADVGVAVGPIGVGAAASTANLSADILAFSRSKGLYGGLSLDGAVVAIRSDWNNAYYGKTATPSDILVKGSAQNPQASVFLDTIANAAKK